MSDLADPIKTAHTNPDALRRGDIREIDGWLYRVLGSSLVSSPCFTIVKGKRVYSECSYTAVKIERMGRATR